jgi:hypothetical protein
MKIAMQAHKFEALVRVVIGLEERLMYRGRGVIDDNFMWTLL